MENPVESLLKVARRVELVAQLIGERLDDASDADPAERMALLGSYRGALQDTAKITGMVVSLGLLERRLAPPEADTARAVGQAVDRAITDDEVGLSFEQIEVFRRVFRRHMAEAFPEQ